MDEKDWSETCSTVYSNDSTFYVFITSYDGDIMEYHSDSGCTEIFVKCIYVIKETSFNLNVE